MKIWVLIADNHEIARAGIRLILANVRDIEIVGEAKNGVDVMRLVAQLQPDVLLLGLEISQPGPIQIVKWIQGNHFDTAVLVLTAYDHAGCLSEMVGVGVSGYLTKHEVSCSLAHAIRVAHNGHPVITDEQWTRIENWRSSVGKRLDSLTGREREVLHQIAQGYSNRTIADNLGISHKTVEYHVTNILSKLGLDSRLQAVVWLRRHGSPCFSK